MSKTAEKLWPEIPKAFPEANFLQSPVWGKVNDLISHKVIIEYNWLDEAGQESEAPRFWCQMIVKNAKRGRYLEVPGGPLVDWQDETAVNAVFAKIRAIAKREKCVFVRIRPQLPKTAQNLQLMQSLHLKTAPMHLHAEHTVILDLTKTPDELLAAMRRQTRYEVRRAQKIGIQVNYATNEAIFQEFHQVQRETALRQNFIPPDLRTLLAEHQAFGKHARIYTARTSSTAEQPDAPIAYGLILIDGAEAEYFEAASTELHHRLPGAYALLWQAAQDLQQLGVKRFNLWGIAPPGQKQHRYAGVTTFKTGFGGEVVEYVPAQDLVIRRGRYFLNWLVEIIRKKRRHL